ncbi:MAG: GAF domain-containing protein, partial [Lachnospiraceae bacterium]|nr:GAF domain-containing protein [Lachnospiraceae bacterium]
ALEDINWAGFYLVRGERLVLGPFQGKVACVHIRRGAGVCGTAWERDETQLVPDVHAFPGHIACDSASNSEIVVPIHRDGEVCGVLDIDSPSFGRFSEADREGLEEFVRVLERNVFFTEEAV